MAPLSGIFRSLSLFPFSHFSVGLCFERVGVWVNVYPAVLATVWLWEYMRRVVFRLRVVVPVCFVAKQLCPWSGHTAWQSWSPWCVPRHASLFDDISHSIPFHWSATYSQTKPHQSSHCTEITSPSRMSRHVASTSRLPYHMTLLSPHVITTSFHVYIANPMSLYHSTTSVSSWHFLSQCITIHS
jgi:hypothetical protein